MVCGYALDSNIDWIHNTNGAFAVAATVATAAACCWCCFGASDVAKRGTVDEFHGKSTTVPRLETPEAPKRGTVDDLQ